MKLTGQRRQWVVLPLLAVLAACDLGPGASAARQWNRASQALASEDYPAALARLDALRTIPGHEGAGTATKVIVLGGLTRGYLEVSDPESARRYALLLAETVADLRRLRDRQEARLALALPADEPRTARLGRDAERTAARTIQRNVLLQFSRSVGAGANVRTVRKMLDLGPVSSPEGLLLADAGGALWEASAVFGPHERTKLTDLAETCLRESLTDGALTLEKDARAALAAIRQGRPPLQG